MRASGRFCVKRSYDPTVFPLSSILESGKGKGELAFLTLSIEIWEAKKEPLHDTHQGTALI